MRYMEPRDETPPIDSECESLMPVFSLIVESMDEKSVLTIVEASSPVVALILSNVILFRLNSPYLQN